MSQKLKLSNILPFAFFVIAVAFFFWVRDANATKPKPPPKTPQEQSQRQNQEQAQHQDQSQNQQTDVDVIATSGDAISTQSATQTITFTSPDDVTIRNTASANPPSVYGSHSCATGGSAGVGVPGFNLAGGRQKIDPECVRREESRLLHAFGERELAIIHLCNSLTMRESLGDACGPSITQEELQRRLTFLHEKRVNELALCAEVSARQDDALQDCLKK